MMQQSPPARGKYGSTQSRNIGDIDIGRFVVESGMLDRGKPKVSDY